jgi:farnesol dehydrogenase
MEKVLVTGAGGFIGSRLTLKLAESGIKVRALYHSKINSNLKHENIEFVKADILGKSSLENAIVGCSKIFHVAALANNWAKNPKQFYDVNVTGTQNVLDTAKKFSIEKIVFTSTAGTIGPSLDGRLITEKNNSILFSDYEKSKAEAEMKILLAVKSGMNIVIVNPTRVFGPGEMSKSNAVTKIIHKYIQRKWKIKIGNGEHIGNYAFVEDIVDGNILAMKNGMTGERYLLGGHNLTFNNFIEIVSNVSGIKNNLVPVPLALIGTYAIIEDVLANLFGLEPKITYSWVKKYMANWSTSIAKAENELGYKITPIETAIEKTITWLKQNENRI